MEEKIIEAGKPSIIQEWSGGQFDKKGINFPGPTMNKRGSFLPKKGSQGTSSSPYSPPGPPPAKKENPVI